MTIQDQDQLLTSIQSLFIQQENDVEDHPQEHHHEEEEEIRPLDRLVRGVKEITGYEFENPNLLRQAFTHNSMNRDCYDGDPSNFSYERLEYVGDSVLNLLIAQEHFTAYRDLTPGKLTRLRAANVDTEKLARVALRHHLFKLLRHNIALLPTQISEFTRAIEDHPMHSWGLIDAPKVLADIVESLIGAIFIDSKSSIVTTWDVAEKLLQPFISPETLRTHPVTKLQEICQKRGLDLNGRDKWKDSGIFEFIVEGCDIIGIAKYPAKRNIAKNRAAQDAYLQLVERLQIDGVP